VKLSALLDGRTDLLPPGWQELSRGDAVDLAALLLGQANLRAARGHRLDAR
jgi:hypothetical protein